METVRFMVQGSAAEPYEVILRRDGNNLTATCTCAAGESGQHCKHRIRILQGSTEAVIEGQEQISTVIGWIEGTDVAVALRSLETAEAKFELAKRSLAAAKRALAGAMGS